MNKLAIFYLPFFNIYKFYNSLPPPFSPGLGTSVGGVNFFNFFGAYCTFY